jgi:hypothetical protein
MSDQPDTVSPGQRAYEAWYTEDGYHLPDQVKSWDKLEPADQARWEESAGHEGRRERLIAEHGMPEHISPSDALALAATALIPTPAGITADDVYASIYRDTPAADAWLESNRVHHGHPELARVPLPDGRVVGILDLRPSLERARRESRLRQ